MTPVIGHLTCTWFVPNSVAGVAEGQRLPIESSKGRPSHLLISTVGGHGSSAAPRTTTPAGESSPKWAYIQGYGVRPDSLRPRQAQDSRRPHTAQLRHAAKWAQRQFRAKQIRAPSP
eukprot:CAMPEP_0181208658 /NCGR_PEP_ID=MMETSP1096-20121128/22240_1 /TAXON_ID=156174 ORGANISM="Chrysochromulina ericina, Strain CCMP281" /NCGR_SAMPLE_ID=MMETSP1096 /ASSEMBLY_ACC=CAM_ASM_000453 /LENGTH=116 /DNA_ID=CAMNT_0023299747 /DNA_START=395 /DNA_END=746 /DNA_ORIENTATION=+